MIIARAPLRISFFGGGTDYPGHFAAHGGAVLGTAIKQFGLVSAAPFHSAMFDYNIRLAYREIERVDALDDIRHRPFREALRLFGIDRDLELHYVADLPAKTGLGSSSTFVVALLHVLAAHQGRDLTGLDLAYEAIRFERRVLGENVGCQDQTFAAVGGLNVLEFRAEDDIRVAPVSLSPQRLRDLQDSLLLVFTGITRSAEEMVKPQIAAMAGNTDRYLGMRRQVDEGFRILTGDGPISAFGELLHDAWEAKRSLHSVISAPEIDAIYDKGRGAGALGGKLLGAGGGGFFLLFVPPERKPAVKAALDGYVTLEVGLDAPGCELLLNGAGKS